MPYVPASTVSFDGPTLVQVIAFAVEQFGVEAASGTLKEQLQPVADAVGIETGW